MGKPRRSMLEFRIWQLERKHGSLRAAAKALKIDVGYLSRLKSGEKTEPSTDVLDKLKLERVVTYRSTEC